MHKYIILLSLLFLSLGITFAVLKSQNDEDVKLNPNAPNYSTLYTWLIILSFILFLSTLFAIYILIKKNNYITPKSPPLLKRNLISYYTPDNENSDNITPEVLRVSSNINRSERLKNLNPFPFN